MTDIMRIGLSALLAQQRALATTANNIANANTPGYSRQRVELTERAVERFGTDSVGTGVTTAQNRRMTDDIIADQLRTAAGGFNRADAFVKLASSLDDLLAGQDTGLDKSLQSFVDSLHDVANDPSSTSARQSFLSEARNLTSRLASMDQRLTQLNDEVRSRLTASTAEINSLGQGIAEANRQILAAGAATGSSPPTDLLDQRDRMLERLSEIVQVDTSAQTDGTMSVFIGSGQVLVLGTTSASLAVASGDFDPNQPRIMLQGSGSAVEITKQLSGGELGGMLDFNREMLAPTRSELGRIAVGIATTVNTANRNGMDANGQLGGDVFAVGGPQTFAAAGNTGTGSVAVSIAGVPALQATNYQLGFNGASYTLQRLDTGAVVPLAGLGTVASPFTADGLSIVVTGAPAAGDRFLLKPLEPAAGSMQLLLTDPSRLAAAAPTRTSAALANIGSGAISAGQVIDVTNANLLNAATIQFIDATHYSVNGAGSFVYTAGGNIDVNGTRVQITGAPAAGDTFTIQSNAGGVGDNRNALRVIDTLGKSVFNGNLTLQGAVSGLVTNVGAKTQEATNQRDAQSLVLDQSKQRLETVRGVNLDEEAADMLRYQNLYQAAAQTMSVAQSLFTTLLQALGRQ